MYSLKFLASFAVATASFAATVPGTAAASNSTSTYAVYPGIDQRAAGDLTEVFVSEEIQCAQQCDSISECVGYVFLPYQSECFLKDDIVPSAFVIGSTVMNLALKAACGEFKTPAQSCFSITI